MAEPIGCVDLKVEAGPSSALTRFRCAWLVDDDRAALAEPVLARIGELLQESGGGSDDAVKLDNFAAQVRAWADERHS
jgi:hypothetical protein